MPDPTATTSLALEAGHYLHLGVFSVSVANGLVLLTMLALFALALVVPFGRRHHDDEPTERNRP